MSFFKKCIPFLLLLLFNQHFLFAQDSPIVQWKTDIKRNTDREYQIQFEGTIQNGWHVYAADSTEGLMGLKTAYPLGAANIVLSSTTTPFVIQKDPVFEGRNKKVITDKIILIQRLAITDQRLSSLSVKLSYEVADQENFIPEEQTLTLALKTDGHSSTALNIPVIETNQSTANCAGETIADAANSSDGHTALFFLGFLGGLIALLTPCVFPMIPLTVSFFTKKSPTKSAGIRNAWLYGFFIFIIYVLLSLPFHFIDSVNPALLNNISTNVYLNSAFFVIFIFFAFSFFGFYEITLPASFSSGADSKAGVGNILGIFFMALTLALVSFSCTGPILGSLLAGSLSADGGAMQLTAGMAGFGLALALPFALFALFPHWLQSLPKSGGWLTTVKIVLGFFELALAFKFLSNADLVQHWGLLKREVFIGIWVIVGLLLTLYLFGKIKLPHDTIPAKISKSRLSLGLLSLLFTCYLLPGLTNTPAARLSLISGFPPPLYYSIYQQDSDCILGLNCSKDFEAAIQQSAAQNKPLLIDFTGYACVNCRRMEENVWSDPAVYQLMKDKFIIVSLYVDDKKPLPVHQQFVYTTKEGVQKQIQTVGDRWSTFETEYFQNNAQPLYAVINARQQLLSKPIGYTPSAATYLQWLNCSLDAYKQNSNP